jgi:hypothetical protein
LEEVLKAYNIEIHHLTPNGIAKIALFMIKSQGVNPDIKAFCALHEMHTQLRNKPLMGRRLSFILDVVVSNRYKMQNKFLQLRRTSGTKTGISIGSIILFLLLKKGMSQGS